MNRNLLFSIGTFLSTLLGGLFALRYQDRLHRILGFSAGVLLGIVAFDVLPEIFHLVGRTRIPDVEPMAALVIGFLVFHVAEKLVAIHQSHEGAYGGHHHPYIGIGSALALVAHSFYFCNVNSGGYCLSPCLEGYFFLACRECRDEGEHIAHWWFVSHEHYIIRFFCHSYHSFS